jgi:hypothetical protein
VIGRAELQRDLVIVACAISAGIHAALVPAHLAEGAAAGVAFGAAAALAAAVAVALTRRASSAALATAAALFAGLIAGYALAVTTGLPLVHPQPEAVEGLALFTKAVELAGLGAAADALVRRHARVAVTSPRPKGTLA